MPAYCDECTHKFVCKFKERVEEMSHLEQLDGVFTATIITDCSWHSRHHDKHVEDEIDPEDIEREPLRNEGYD